MRGYRVCLNDLAENVTLLSPQDTFLHSQCTTQLKEFV